ncbi:MAG TPA: PD-(D/E)XK nuclease family protein [Candidatus Baltobacteraceae bacterium]
MHLVPHAAAFVADALAWSRDADEARVRRLLRSPRSGVAHDVAAAYSVVGARFGSLLDAIGRERLALPAPDRDAALGFARNLERLRTVASQGTPDEALERLVEEAFPNVPEGVPASSAGANDAIALTQPQSAEPGTGMRARQKHFSASSLNAYAECPRKWFYRYSCGAIEDAGSSASFYGTAFHAALEYFHETFPRPDPGDAAVMLERIARDVARAFEAHRADFETHVEFVLQLRRAQRTARRYVAWLVARAKRSPFTVIGRELPAALQIEGFDFIGFIDRLDRDDATGGVTVIDYKTGSIAASAQEYREKVRSFSDFQLPFYYWAREAAGDRVATLALVPLKDALLDVRPIELEVVPLGSEPKRRNGDAYGTIGIGDLERARAKMAQICRELTDESITHFPVTDDPSACTYCAYADACNDRPAALEEKFGR